MKRTFAKVASQTDGSTAAFITIVQDDAGRQEWWKWGGTLSLTEKSGVWIYRPKTGTRSSPELLLMDSSGQQNHGVMVLWGMPPDFFDSFGTKVLTGTGVLNDFNFTPINWAIWAGLF
jgi:hypothetical protein